MHETRLPEFENRDVQSFFDRLVPDLMQQHHVPGSVIAVVKDGEPVLVQGYGYARLSERVPVDADRSLFRIASVTKLFTWTAVMQLVQQGKLDLDADINQYLAHMQIPGGYAEPVTMANLMSHTAGFEDRGLIGTLAHHPSSVQPLHDYLVDRMPARVRPPGRVSAYSNFGGALAGHIVAEVSGLPYEQYMREKIFAPLRMQHATVDPTPPDDRMVSGYAWRGGAYRAIPYSYVIPVPEGGINASGTSMSRFLIAHLEGGQYQGQAILRSETVRQMHRQSFTHHPALSGWAHGFQENQVNGLRILEHGGRLQHFTNSLVLVPSQRLGLFMSFNSHGGSVAGHKLKKQFFDRFFPAATTGILSETNPADSTPDVIGGYYAPSRHSQTTLAKLGTLLQASRCAVEKDQSMYFLGRHWLPFGKDLMRSSDGQELLACGNDAGGRQRYLFVDHLAWQRLPWYQTPVFHLTLLGSSLLMFFSAVVWLPAVFLRSRMSRTKGTETKSRIPNGAGVAAFACSAVNIALIVGLVFVLSGDTSQLEFGVPPGLKGLLVMPVISVVLAVFMLTFSVGALRSTGWNRFGRIWYVCATAAAWSFVWFLGFWNLLGWHF